MKIPTFAIHANNQPVHALSHADQSWLYISKLWAHRRSKRVQEIIRGHIAMIRRWNAR